MVTILVLIIVFVLAIAAFCYHQTNYIQVNTVKVKIKNLPKEFRNFTIIQITDLHGKRYGKDQCHLLKLMDHKDFDILVLTGDMFRDNDEKNSLSVLRYVIDYVHSKAKSVYFVAGTHLYSIRNCLKTEYVKSPLMNSGLFWVVRFEK